jgi:hypothetical protein
MMESNLKEDEGKLQDDWRESCLMCGACEIHGKGCLLHVRTFLETVSDVVEAEHDESLKHKSDAIDSL